MMWTYHSFLLFHWTWTDSKPDPFSSSEVSWFLVVASSSFSLQLWRWLSMINVSCWCWFFLRACRLRKRYAQTSRRHNMITSKGTNSCKPPQRGCTDISSTHLPRRAAQQKEEREKEMQKQGNNNFSKMVFGTELYLMVIIFIDCKRLYHLFSFWGY